MAYTVNHIEDIFNPQNSIHTYIIDPIKEEDQETTVGNIVNQIDPVLNGYELVAKVNSKPVHMDTEIKNGDSLTFAVIPEGDNVLRTVLMVVIAFVAAYTGAWVAGSFKMITTSAAGITTLTIGGKIVAGLVSSAIMVGGSMIVNSILPPTVPDAAMAGSLDDSPTYGWTSQPNADHEGASLPYLIGTKRITPPIISQYIETRDDKQWLYLLFAVGSGEIKGVTGNKIWVNGTTLFDDDNVPRIEDVNYEWRSGTKDQDSFKWFDIIWSANDMSQVQLTEDFTPDDTIDWGDEVLELDTYSTVKTTDNTTRFNIKINFPLGMYAYDVVPYTTYGRDGETVYGYRTGSVSYEFSVAYKKENDNTWTYVGRTFAPHNIFAFAHNMTRIITISELPTAKYDVKIKRTNVLGVGDAVLKALNNYPVPYTETTNGDQVQHLECLIYLPALFYADPYEGIVEATVEVFAEYRATDAEAWETGESIVITEATKNPIRRSITFSDLPPDEYEIRVQFTDIPETGTEYATTTYWAGLQEGIDGDDFEYPGKALLAVKALATDQLSGQRPRIECLVSSTGEWISKTGTNTLEYYTDLPPAEDVTPLIVETCSTSVPEFVFQCYHTTGLWVGKREKGTSDWDREYVGPIGVGEYTYTPDSQSVDNMEWSFLLNQTSEGFILKFVDLEGYTQWPSGNPSHEAQKFLKLYGISESNISSNFDDWADFCNSPPADDYDSEETYSKNKTVKYSDLTYIALQETTDNAPSGTNEPTDYWQRFALTANLYIDQAISFQEALNQISLSGRGAIVQRGLTWDVIWERETSRISLVTSGNMIEDSFEEEFIDSSEFANVVELTYFTQEAGRTVVEVRAPDFDTSDEDKRSSLVLYGCDNREQAIQHGTLILNSTRLQSRICTWEQSTDSIKFQVSDVVGVQTNQIQWSFGGRVVSADNDSVTLDRDDITGLSTPKILVRHSSDNTLETVLIDSFTDNGDGTQTAELSTSWNKNPSEHDVYSIGESTEVIKDFRITSINRNSDSTRQITGIEYISEIYAADEILEDEVEVYTFTPVKNLELVETTRPKPDGTTTLGIFASWEGVNPKGWNVYSYLVTDSGNIQQSQKITYEPYLFIETDNKDTEYKVQVFAIDAPEDSLNSISKTKNVTGDNVVLNPNLSEFTVKSTDGTKTIAPFEDTTVDGVSTVGLKSPVEAVYVNDPEFGEDGIQLEYNKGTPRLYAGDGSDEFFKYDGTHLTWKAANTELDSSGNLIAASATISGTVTAAEINGSVIDLADCTLKNEYGATCHPFTYFHDDGFGTGIIEYNIQRRFVYFTRIIPANAQPANHDHDTRRFLTPFAIANLQLEVEIDMVNSGDESTVCGVDISLAESTDTDFWPDGSAPNPDTLNYTVLDTWGGGAEFGDCGSNNDTATGDRTLEYEYKLNEIFEGNKEYWVRWRIIIWMEQSGEPNGEMLGTNYVRIKNI